VSTSNTRVDALVEGVQVGCRARLRAAPTPTPRPGQHVVQAYASRPGRRIDRPVRWLVGFATVHVRAGATRLVRVPVPARASAHWDNGWCCEHCRFELAIGDCASDVVSARSVEIGRAP
jgi:beta-glucosidase